MGRWLRRASYFITTAGLLARYAVLWQKQRNPDYLCQRLEVQFGDGFYRILPLFSGHFELRKDLWGDFRYSYADELSGQSFFRYCRSEEAWLFAIHDSDEDFVTTLFHLVCDTSAWISKSPETAGFNILENDAMSWQTTTDKLNFILYPVDYFTLRCAELQSIDLQWNMRGQPLLL